MSARIFPQGSRLVNAVIGVVMAVALSACVAQFRNHGYMPTAEALGTLQIGADTKDSVREKVGAPGVEGILASSGWYYVRSRFQHLGAFEPKEVDREVLALSFDGQGVLRNVERFGLDQGRVVVLERRVTEANVQGVTFIQQLFGNLGNISAEQLLQ